VRKSTLLGLLLLAAACGRGADTLERGAGVGATDRSGERVAGEAAIDTAAGATTVDSGAPFPAVATGGAAPLADPAIRDTTFAGRPGRDDSRGVVLFLGNSLTAGLGVGPDSAFPAIIQRKIDSADLPYRVVNAGVSGETSAGGLARLDWLLRSPVDVLVLELGANDGLRGLPVEHMRANLDSILVRTKRRYANAALVLAGMEAPPNLGESYTAPFRAVFRDLATLRHVSLVPFLLDGVAGDPALNQSDGLHPTAEGHRIVADNIWAVLGPVLTARAKRGYR